MILHSFSQDSEVFLGVLGSRAQDKKGVYFKETKEQRPACYLEGNRGTKKIFGNHFLFGVGGRGEDKGGVRTTKAQTSLHIRAV